MDFQSEAIEESVKNMLLVLTASSALSEELWTVTWSQLEPWLPQLKTELGSAQTGSSTVHIQNDGTKLKGDLPTQESASVDFAPANPDALVI